MSPVSHFHRFIGPKANGAAKNSLLVYADYDLTFPREYSLQSHGVRFERRVLPCGHYTTGETPFKYMDGWYMGWFVYRAFKELRREKAAGLRTPSSRAAEIEEELISR